MPHVWCLQCGHALDPVTGARRPDGLHAPGSKPDWREPCALCEKREVRHD